MYVEHGNQTYIVNKENPAGHTCVYGSIPSHFPVAELTLSFSNDIENVEYMGTLEKVKILKNSSPEKKIATAMITTQEFLMSGGTEGLKQLKENIVTVTGRDNILDYKIKTGDGEMGTITVDQLSLGVGLLAKPGGQNLEVRHVFAFRFPVETSKYKQITTDLINYFKAMDYFDYLVKVEVRFQDYKDIVYSTEGMPDYNAYRFKAK